MPFIIIKCSFFWSKQIYILFKMDKIKIRESYLYLSESRRAHVELEFLSDVVASNLNLSIYGKASLLMVLLFFIHFLSFLSSLPNIY